MPSKSRSMSVTSPATARSVLNVATSAPVSPLMTKTRLPFVEEQDGVAVSVSSQESYPPPKMTSGVVVLNPLTSATLGIDQVCPICVNPVVQPVSSLRFGQPTRHLSTGEATLVTSQAYTTRPPRRMVL